MQGCEYLRLRVLMLMEGLTIFDASVSETRNGLLLKKEGLRAAAQNEAAEIQPLSRRSFFVLYIDLLSRL